MPSWSLPCGVPLFDHAGQSRRVSLLRVADYADSIEGRRVVSTVKPGHLGELLPDSAPIDRHGAQECRSGLGCQGPKATRVLSQHRSEAARRSGVIYGSASEAIILTMTAAREKYLALPLEEHHAVANMFSHFHLISARTNGYY
ncbi:hypothetical protein E5D57_012507 [Metarhizium anisopliae]|nr:hypothetical protein E5D57_012507 [Metarhizium anisopliae]